MGDIIGSDLRRTIQNNSEMRRFIYEQNRYNRKQLLDYVKHAVPNIPEVNLKDFEDRIKKFEHGLAEQQIAQAIGDERRLTWDTGGLMSNDPSIKVPETREVEVHTKHGFVKVPMVVYPKITVDSLIDKDHDAWLAQLPAEKKQELDQLLSDYQDARTQNVAIAKLKQDYRDQILENAADYDFGMSENLQNMKNEFAPLYASRLNRQVMSGSRIGLIRSAAKDPFQSRQLSSPEAIKQFGALTIKDFNDAFEDSHLSYEGFQQFYTGFGIKETLAENYRAVENIEDKGGRAVLWDLETFGPRTKYGRPQGQRITEFSFIKAQGDFETGKFETFENAGGLYASIIGTSQEEYEEQLALIKRYTTGGEITEGERVTLNRLALMGAKKTQIDWNDPEANARGVYRYKSFAEQGDIGETAEEMLNGAKELREVGRRQAKAPKINGMYGWEHELLLGLHSIIDEDITAVGHNTAGFDIRQLNALLHNPQMTTKAFRDAVSKLLGNKALAFKHNLDDLQIEHSVIDNRQEFLLDFFDGDERKLSQLNRWMKDNDKTQLTQETLLEAYRLKYGLPRVQNAAHIAVEDARGTGTLLFATGLFSPDPDAKKSLFSPLFDGESSPKRIVPGHDLFYAVSSFDPNKEGTMAFVRDAMTGQYRTSDGVSIGNFGAEEESFPQNGAKRRGLYQVTGIGTLTENSPVYKAIAASHEDMANGSLWYINLTPYTNPDENAPAARSRVTWVGSKEQLVQQLNSYFVHAGYVDNNGNFEKTEMNERDERFLSHVTVDRNGKKTITPYSIKELVDDSTFAFANDSAARVARDKSASKDVKLLNYIHDMDQFAKSYVSRRFMQGKDGSLIVLGGDPSKHGMSYDEALEVGRSKFRESVYQRTVNLMQDHYVKTGKPITNVKHTYYDYFGWQSREDGTWHLYSNTAANAIQLEQYGRHNERLINMTLDYARKQSGIDVYSDPLFQAYYAQGRQAVEDAAVLNTKTNRTVTNFSKVDKSALGYTSRGRVLAETLNQFEVDLDGFRGENMPGGKIVRFNTAASGIGVADKIYRALGLSNEFIKNNITTEDKLMMLYQFQERMAAKNKDEKGKTKLPKRYRIDLQNDSLDVAGSKVLGFMQKLRFEDPNAGVLTPTEQHDVIHTNIDNMGLTEKQIQNALDVNSRSFVVAPNRFTPPNIKKLPNGRVEYEWGKNREFETFIDNLATEINDKVLFNTGISDNEEDFIKEMMRNGYSERDARRLYKSQLIKKGESKKVVSNLLKLIYANGGMVGYNEQEGKVFMFNDPSEYKSQVAHELYLPRQSFEDGAFFVRTGENGTRHIDPLMVGTKNVDGVTKLRLTSIMGDAADKVYAAGRVFYDNAQKGTLDSAADWMIRKITSAYQDFSTAMVGDNQDRIMANTLYYGDATKAFSTLATTEALQRTRNGATIASQVLDDMMESSASYDLPMRELSYSQASALLQNVESLGQAISDSMIENKEFFDQLLPGMSHIAEHGGSSFRGFVSLTEDTGNALESTHLGKNGIESKLNRSALFTIPDETKYNRLRYYGVTYGSILRSPYEEARATGAGKNLGYSVEDTIVGNRLSIETDDFRRLIATADEKGYFDAFSDSDHYAYKMLTAGSTDEGASMLSVYLADEALSHRFYEQHIEVARVGRANNPHGGMSSRNYSRLAKGDLGAVTSDLSIDEVTDKNGQKQYRISYHSNNGIFVKEGDTLFEKEGAYGRSEPVRAKQTGFLRMGVFQDGMQLSDTRVSDILNEDENRKRIIAAGKNWREEAFNILQNTKGLRHDYYVDELDVSGNIKFSDLNEKNTGVVLMAGIGDTKGERGSITALFRAMGASELLHHRVTADFITELNDEYTKDSKADITKTKFGIAVNAIRQSKDMGKLDRESMLAFIQADFQTVSNFADELWEERVSPTQKLHDVLVKMGVLRSGEHILSVVNNFAGQNKHGDTTAVKSLAMSLVELAKKSHKQNPVFWEKYPNAKADSVYKEKVLEKEAFRSVLPILQQVLGDSVSIAEDEHHKYFQYSGGQIDLDAYQRVVKTYFPEGFPLDKKGKHHKHLMRWTFDSTGGDPMESAINFEVAPTEYRQLQNLDEARTSSDGTHEVKIDERVFNNMISHRYTKSFLDSAESRLKSVLGDALGSSLYSTYISGHKEGDILNAGLVNYAQRGMWATFGEKRIYDAFNSDFTDKEAKAAYDKLTDLGLSKSQINSTVDAMKGAGADKITWDKVAEYFRATSYAMAHNFNRPKDATTTLPVDEMEKAGFRRVGIDALDVDASHAFLEEGSDGYNKFMNSINGQQLLIDLHSDELEKKGAKQIYKSEAERYLAIPIQMVGTRNPNGSIMTSKIGGQIMGLMREFERYRDDYVSTTGAPDGGEAGHQEDLEHLAERVDTIRQQITNETTAKTGVLKSASVAHITDSVGNLTAQAHEFLGSMVKKGADGKYVSTGVSLDGQLGRHLKFLGINLSELATRNKLNRLNGGNPEEIMEIGHAILGQHAMEAWYNDDFFKTLTGGQEGLAEKLKSKVVEGLHQGEATLTGVLRHPAQRNRSMGAIPTFFDETIANDELAISVREMLQKKGDFDSDKLSSLIIKSRATIHWGAGQDVKTDRLDFATYNQLKKMGVNVELHDDNFKEAIGDILTAALDYNPKAAPRDSSWKNDSLDFSDKFMESSTYDGKHTVDYGRTYTAEERTRERANWNSLKHDFLDYAEQNNIDLSKYKEGDSDYLSEMAKYASTLGNQSQAALETMHYHAWETGMMTLRNAATSKAAAGPLNTTLYKWQRIGTLSKALTPDEENLMRAGIAAAQEGTLTGKSESGETNIRRVEEAQKVHNDAYRAMRSGKNLKEAAANLENFYRQIFVERASKGELDLTPGNFWGRGNQSSWWLAAGGAKREAEIIANNAGKTEKAINDLIVAEQAAALQAYMVKTIDMRGVSSAAFRIGVTATGLDSSTELTTLEGTAEDSMQARAHSVVNSLAESLGAKTPVMRPSKAPSLQQRGANTARAQQLRQEAQQRATQIAATQGASRANQITRGASSQAHEMMGRDIRKIAGVFDRSNYLVAAAIGIAGGLLTAGYVSGPAQKQAEPSTPAQNQASDQAQDEQDMASMQQVPNLSDANMNVMRGGPNSGYIININANSPNGEQSAINAIQNAASAMTPQNGSINLSISSSPSDQLNQLQINRMVANAIGVASR